MNKIASDIFDKLYQSYTLGLKAMKSMQEKNIKKDTLSDEMMMFIVLNTTQKIPIK